MVDQLASAIMCQPAQHYHFWATKLLHGGRWHKSVSYNYLFVVDTDRKRTLRLPVAVALKFTVRVVQAFIKGHRKSGVRYD